MDEAVIHILAGVLSVVFGYAIMARGLLYATQPLRSRCIDLYAKIVASGRADEALINRLDGRLEELYSGLTAWQLTVSLICAVFVTLPYKKIRHMISGAKISTYNDDFPESLRNDIERFDANWIAATVANSPTAALIFAIVGIVGIAFYGSLGILAKIISSHAPLHHHRHAH